MLGVPLAGGSGVLEVPEAAARKDIRKMSVGSRLSGCFHPTALFQGPQGSPQLLFWMQTARKLLVLELFLYFTISLLNKYLHPIPFPPVSSPLRVTVMLLLICFLFLGSFKSGKERQTALLSTARLYFLLDRLVIDFQGMLKNEKKISRPLLSPPQSESN